MMAMAAQRRSEPQAKAAAKLELRGLAKSFRANAVVDALDLEIAAGESVVLLGPSGCGKTTTLRMIAGFVRPDAGEIRLDGVAVASPRTMLPPERRRLGMVFQNYAVWPHKTVFGNIAYGLVVAGCKRDEIARRVRAALDAVRLVGLDDRSATELSGGQQQRVALARAIVTEPSMLLLDEPLSNLDAGLREEMRHELRELQRRIGMTSLYVTHDQEEALVLADRIVVMNRGRVEQIGSPLDIYLRPATRFVAGFVGANNIVDGVVVAADTERRRVSVAMNSGLRLWASAADEVVARCAAGDSVTVAIRPEGIILGDRPPAGETTIAATPVSVTFLGNRYEITLDCGGQRLRCQAQRIDKIHDGTVAVSVDPDLAWIVV